MQINEALAIILKKYRKACGYSQEELAYKCGLDRTYISLLERGRRNPTINVIFVISYNLNMRPSEFIKDIENLLSSE